MRFLQIFGLSALTACQLGSPPTATPNSPTDLTIPEKPTIPEKATAAPDAQPTAPPAPSSAYGDAVNLASGAVTLGQQATSLDDWSLIVGRWEQAIEMLKQVPAEDPNHGIAQTKLRDYGQNLAQAQYRLKTLQQPPPEIPLARPTAPPRETTAATVNQNPPPVPIIERRSGTPVIEVSFNGKPYPMILDTGASHTHIPRAMANELGIKILGQTSVATASSDRAVVDIGSVASIKVGNIQRTNLPISIGDAVPIGLLGNDVYQGYDVILQANSVEFRPR